jgi:DMSO reductase anchor subunit
MWRRSWLSREVLLFGCFSGVAAGYAAALWFGLPGGWIIGGVTTVFGIAGVTASACIYRVPARPAWNTRYTLVQFNLTAATLGPLFAAAAGAGDPRWLAVAAAAGAGAQLILLALRFFRCIASDRLELRGTARLLSTVFAKHFVMRGALLAIGAVLLPLAGVVGPPATFATDVASAAREGGPYIWIGLACALASEVLGRYLFFVTVVPTHMAAPYLAAESEAA